MKKVIICLIGCFLSALPTLRAQDMTKADTAQSPMDTTLQTGGGSVISRDTVATPTKDTQSTDSVISLADDPAPGWIR